jgi:hypothetical protein
VKPFLRSLGVMLHDFLTSKKVMTAVCAGVAAAITKNPELQKYFAEIGVSVILGFTVGDHGKAKVMVAEIAAAAEKPPAPRPEIPPLQPGAGIP